MSRTTTQRRSLFEPRAVAEGALGLIAATLIATAGLGACGSDGDEGSSTGGTTPTTTCERDTRKDIYAPGMTKQSASFVVSIVDSTPSPPAKLTNALTLKVADLAGKPIDGASITITPWMPDHAHGSAAIPEVKGMGNGQYAVTKLYYPMPGLWQITMTIQAQGAAPQDVVFNFCLEG